MRKNEQLPSTVPAVVMAARFVVVAAVLVGDGAFMPVPSDSGSDITEYMRHLIYMALHLGMLVTGPITIPLGL
ncbi:hypothetical protein [Streptomyces broussonetiae]|uniref:Uncharacterized protein n=1 Tax=Streptomyces broussonetiae TaxID=2686304 RepID=A0A6I6NFL6_9ACTN|nr:hypothetical protein [Streptomyces broussonetiae]QHA09131.1 hypothetical protein GQF42_43285 [Streptomyces broussonetiae]